jgi:hypothetical protein
MILNIARVEKSLSARLRSSAPVAGRVLKSWGQTFILVDPQNRPIYFFDRMPLHVPFGVAMDFELGQPGASFHVRQGSLLERRGQMLWLTHNGETALNIDSGREVDLSWNKQNITLKAPPRAHYIQVLGRIVAALGDSRGLAGVLNCLSSNSKFSLEADSSPLPVSPYALYAMEYVELLLTATQEQQLKVLLEACRGLIGCGPGLTPSGDDFLVGFLAAHYLSGSALVKEFKYRKLDSDVVAMARKQTTLVSAEMLACAVKGKFSEILYQAWRALPDMANDSNQNGPVQRFLSWGSTSGTDTIVGLALGLATLTTTCK